MRPSSNRAWNRSWDHATGWLVGAFLVVLGCYQQPKIPTDKPLPCESDQPGECPTGFTCIDHRVCAPQTCVLSNECPEGLVCGRNGCGLPGADGGLDGASSTEPPDAEASPTPDLDGGVGAVLDVGGGS